LLTRLTGLLPPEGIKIIVVLFLSFLIGLEREEHRAVEPAGRYYFGGVRTFPLIGLIGYALALLAGDQVMPVIAGFAVVAAFFWLSYQNKLRTLAVSGVRPRRCPAW
jgi:MgtC family